MLIGDKRILWPAGKGPGWKHTDDGMDGGRFGAIEHSVVVSANGDGTFTPLFDRAITREGGHVITLPFGQNQDGEWVVGLIKEARDTAAPADGVSSIAFWGPPRGFCDENETPEEAAKREAGEEAGAKVFHSIRFIGNFITNETCTSSWSPWVALETDPAALEVNAPQHGEKIYKVQFFNISQAKAMIAAGEHDGASTRSMVLVTTVFLFEQLVAAL
jgi:8-oxo-dGTP pyrophosphatase MutT (NUDIX family)